MGKTPTGKAQAPEPPKSLDQMSDDELIELAGGQKKLDEQFYKLFGPPKKA